MPGTKRSGKCDRCNKPATHFPLIFVPDMPIDLDPDLCDDHYDPEVWEDKKEEKEMAKFKQTPSFTCDLCEEHVDGQSPLQAELRIGNHLKQFDMCRECFAPSRPSTVDQDRNIFQRAWQKFFGKKG